MAQHRNKDSNWTVTPDVFGKFTHEQAALCVLMDIRDELKRLNSLLHCQNFTAIPFKLDKIERNTRKRRKKPVANKPNLRVVGGTRS